MDVNYNNVKELMLKNNWFTPHHTHVPGPDGKLSYGELVFQRYICFIRTYESVRTPHMVLESVVKERNTMRDD